MQKNLSKNNIVKFLIIGDIYGSKGLSTFLENISKIKQKHNPTITIANCENVSIGGKSLVKEDYLKIKKSGVDFITMGNHTFKNKGIYEYINEVNDLVRPANFPNETAGKGHIVFNLNGKKVLLVNMLGQTFIEPKGFNPFSTIDKIIDETNYDFAIMDFHAETTSEKHVFSNYLKNKFNIFFGTHTHVQTADERIIGNMAYITDVGMCGVLNSSIGANFEEVERKMRFDTQERFKEATEGTVRVNYIVVEADWDTMRVLKIERGNLDV